MLKCKNLNELPSLKKLKYIAGKNGLNRVVRWTYIAESQSFSEWIHGHELLIISGAVIRNADFDLDKLIDEAIGADMSGALLLSGENYITIISPKTIQKADNSAFPLMEIGWQTPLVDILEDIGRAILQDNVTTHQEEDIINNLLFSNTLHSDFLIEQGALLNYPLTGCQQMLLFYFAPEQKTADIIHQQRDTVRELLRQLFRQHNLPVLLSAYHNHIIMLCPANEEKLAVIVDELKAQAIISLPETKFYIGIGKAYTELSQLKTSFNEASKCVQLLSKLKTPNSYCFFAKIGLYGLFMAMDKQAIRSFYQQTLGELISYDTANNTELLETLRIYLEHNCNAAQTAQQLFIHRNTLNYRLQRIEQITGKALDIAYYRLELQNALFVGRLLL